MAHNPYETMISLAFDGMLDEAEELELVQHLEDCPACADLRDRMQAVDVMLARPVYVAPPADFTVGVMSRINRYETSKKWTPWIIAVLSLVSVFAALSIAAPVLVLTLGLWQVVLTLPVVGRILTAGLHAFSDLYILATLAFEALTDWYTFLINDPVTLAIVITALVLASTFIGLLEALKTTRLAMAGQST